MDLLSLPRVAALGFIAGAAAALGWIGVYALRSAAAITKGHRWYQLKQL